MRVAAILFPGCNFSSFYPNATKKIANLFKKEYNIGIAFDCCGKPVTELGMKEYENNIIKNLEKNMELYGIEEIITLCPNCYYFLKPRISVKIVTIYEKMSELGIKIPDIDHFLSEERTYQRLTGSSDRWGYQRSRTGLYRVSWQKN